jgi:hypothetical protein
MNKNFPFQFCVAKPLKISKKDRVNSWELLN